MRCAGLEWALGGLPACGTLPATRNTIAIRPRTGTLWPLPRLAARGDATWEDCLSPGSGRFGGRRQGWLTPEGLEDVCAFMAPAKADGAHFTGAKRCLAMKECYADRSIR